MDAPAVAVSHDGKKAATAWMDMRSGTRDVLWSLGGPEVTVHDNKAGLQGHPSLAITKEGVVWCAWEDGRGGPNEQRIYVADSTSRKNLALSAPEEGKCGYPSLAHGGGWTGAAYESKAGISVRRVPP